MSKQNFSEWSLAELVDELVELGIDIGQSDSLSDDRLKARKEVIEIKKEIFSKNKRSI